MAPRKGRERRSMVRNAEVNEDIKKESRLEETQDMRTVQTEAIQQILWKSASLKDGRSSPYSPQFGFSLGKKVNLCEKSTQKYFSRVT